MLNQILEKFGGQTYQARAIRGAAMTVVRFGGQNVLRLGSNLILTRLLFPEAFGLMALVTVVLVAAANFSDVGIQAAVVQHKRGHDPVFLNTAWMMQIARGVVLCLAIILLAHPIADFYETPQLVELLYLSSLVPLLQGFNSTRIATARREIQLERYVMLELFVQTMGIIVMIALSWWLRSVWGLAIGTLVAPFLMAILSHVYLKGGEPNRIQCERDALSILMGFGKWVFFGTIAGFFINQGDRAVLGKYVSLDDLAIFNIGFFLATVPRLLNHAIADSVVYPLYARRPPAESKANAHKINKARMLMTGGMIVVVAFLALIGDWLVRLLYDPRYEAAGPLLIVAALGTLPMIISQSYQLMPLAYGDSHRFAIYYSARAALIMALLFLTVPVWGMWAAALAPGLAVILIHPFMIWTIRPYKAWDIKHDLIFAGFSVLIAAVVFWVHGDLLKTAIQPIG